MIEKLDIIRDSENCVDAFGDTHNVAGHNVISKVNELINTVNELEHTRKALDVAVDALKEIDKTRSVANHKIGTQDKTLNSGIVFCWATPDEIHNAIAEITALKQKDVK